MVERLASNHDNEKMQRSCNSIIAFDNVFRLYFSCESGFLYNKIDLRSCNINLQMGTTTPSTGDRCNNVIIET